MAKITVYKDESFESALRRFKKQFINDGTLDDYRKHEYYKSKAVRKREKRIEAQRRQARKSK